MLSKDDLRELSKHAEYGHHYTIEAIKGLARRVWPEDAVDPDNSTLRTNLCLMALRDNEGQPRDPYTPWVHAPDSRGVYMLRKPPPKPLIGLCEDDIDTAALMSYRPADGLRKPRGPRTERNPEVPASRPRKHRACGGICGYCGRGTGVYWHAVVAHIESIASGGDDVVRNAFIAHPFCNHVAKENKSVAETREVLKSMKPPVMIDTDEPAADRALRDAAGCE